MSTPYMPEEIMVQLNGEILKKLARTLGVGKGLTRKLDVAREIGGHLRAHLPAVLALCSDIERKALAEAAHDPALEVDATVFFGKYGAGFPCCPDSYRAKDVSPYHALVSHNEEGALVISPDIAEALRP
ncbi:MAG: hypothetical protein HY343_01435, partial [Lentisphaerae bacterium]|nr:hypothetical protein [Lentisphaerota bacterium]